MFLIAEVFIYAFAFSASGEKSYITLYDKKGEKVWQSAGGLLTSYQKLTLEKKFGPLRNYRIDVERVHRPFPFRAWMAAAVSIPVATMLLIAFIVRAYSGGYGEEDKKKGRKEKASSSPVGTTRFGLLSDVIRNLSVLHIGLLLLVIFFILWMVPTLMTNLGQAGIDLAKKFKWLFTGFSVLIGLFVVWVIYLRYEFSKEMLDSYLEVQKKRIEEELPPETLKPSPVSDSAKESEAEGGSTQEAAVGEDSFKSEIRDEKIPDADSADKKEI